MTKEEQQKIHEKARKLLCKTRCLPLSTNMATTMALEKMLDFIDTMVDETYPLDEFEQELKDFIESCGGKFTNSNKDEVNTFIRCEAAKLRRIWREEQKAEGGGEVTYERFVADIANSIPKRDVGWKPSVEQLQVMQEAVAYFGDSWVSNKHKVLESLYKDLMKV